uniref:Thioredoxin domain-containing protein n=1 Tax=viral metagenome TaxID=1070528 RepID=A0A6C0AMJ2_9ZZZZ
MANMRLILIVGIVIAILAYISTVVSVGGVRLDAFSDLGQKSNVFTMYYMNGCPHCESILPDYKNFAAAGQIELNGKKTKIRMLEQGDSSAAPELEARNVKGFPTFILSTVDGKFVEYQGDRSVDAIKKFIGQNAV